MRPGGARRARRRGSSSWRRDRWRPSTSPRAPTRTRHSLSLPGPLAEFPTLHALRAVTGAVGEHSVLADRGWKMPALERMDQDGWDVDELGRFISSSQSLKEVGGRWRSWGQWAAVFEHFPEAPGGQPGPLSHLKTIGGIKRHGGWETAEQYLAGVRRLRDVLTSRGCRKSLTSLDVEIPPFAGHDDLSALLSVDGFINTCCTSPNVPLNVRIVGGFFNLAVFYADAFPPRPSPFIKTAIKEAARQADKLTYAISQHDITHPIDDPSPAAIDIASSLSFVNVRLRVGRECLWLRPPSRHHTTRPRHHQPPAAVPNCPLGERAVCLQPSGRVCGPFAGAQDAQGGGEGGVQSGFGEGEF
ncbi:unnamed protein product [Vitrella brassicaformis CCMP3155]|uniref:Uncharacterized protein n=1 Tax=Vitrella brassicaformis (strain CCMP3155) TaxID=1169540 RepID=A0A0G4E9P5_VITBC|nr:unnamed protein product [Vitrella brassicaformis CCMP3155]|eukprot:CEL91915.1 unnamed protein product [Vitrella brassicaformis CCMP3155]